MYEWFTKITITCFAASYLVTLVLEVSRLFFRAPIRLAVMLAFAVAGLFAQTAHIMVEAKEGADIGLPLSRWYDWCLIASWVLAAIYIVYTFRRPKSVAGLFLLPVILILIVLAEFFFGPSFPAQRVALLRMGQIHGIGLLLGTVIMILGFVAGLMYLAQSYRLKRKLPRREGLKLPSLEWLQRVNRRALSLSSIFIACGLIAGVVLNLINHRVPWTEPLVITSGVLLLWLIVAMLFEYLYKPAREGRKVAYLTIASFVFLGLVLCTVFFDFTTSHGQATPKNSESKSQRWNGPSERSVASLGLGFVFFGPSSWGSRPRLSTVVPSGLPRGGSQ